jgi:hypothetical protein
MKKTRNITEQRGLYFLTDIPETPLLDDTPVWGRGGTWRPSGMDDYRPELLDRDNRTKEEGG